MSNRCVTSREMKVLAHDEGPCHICRPDGYYLPPSIDDRLRQVAGQSLAGWIIKLEATTPSEVTARQAQMSYI